MPSLIRRRTLLRGAPFLFLFFFLPVLTSCGDGQSASVPAAAGEPTVTPPRDEPAEPPADDEPELTPPEKSPEEDEIEAGPLPPPEAPPPETEIRRLCFSPEEDCIEQLLQFMEAETEEIDIAIYHLYDSRISRLLVDKHRAGVRVRVLADRHAFTIKPQHARELNFLAEHGVQLRTNRFRGIIHHKYTILRGLGLVEHGSMNYTSIASRKIFNGTTGRVEWNDEIAFFTTNPRVVARFEERFDRAWANTGDGSEAYRLFTTGMDLPTFEDTEANRPFTCYEDPVPDPKPLPDDPELTLCFGGDQQCNREMVAPLIAAEDRRLDLIVFRITVDSIIGEILDKARAGLPIRVIFERSQYRSPAYPSMTAFLESLWEIGLSGGAVQIKATAHPGFLHMKSVITSTAATWGSSNFTGTSSRQIRGCQSSYYQTEDMMVARDPDLVSGMRAQFDQMWNSSDFAVWTPDTPVAASGGADE